MNSCSLLPPFSAKRRSPTKSTARRDGRTCLAIRRPFFAHLSHFPGDGPNPNGRKRYDPNRPHAGWRTPNRRRDTGGASQARKHSGGAGQASPRPHNPHPGCPTTGSGHTPCLSGRGPCRLCPASGAYYEVRRTEAAGIPKNLPKWRQSIQLGGRDGGLLLYRREVPQTTASETTPQGHVLGRDSLTPASAHAPTCSELLATAARSLADLHWSRGPGAAVKSDSSSRLPSPIEISMAGITF